MLKTPISYYGGKQRLVPEILPLIPPHTQYVEPFCGGAAVFWAKKPSAHEVINDLDGRVVNFYRVMQTRFTDLERLIRGTVFSESDYVRAKHALEHKNTKPIKRAWAFWVQTNMSFSHKLGAGFGHSNTSNTGKADAPRKVSLKKESLGQSYAGRIELAEIFCRDAVDLIALKDSPDTFFYIDPPYVSSECGHYKGYTSADFQRLLDTLGGIKGKFLLSSYPEPELIAARERYGWHTKDLQKAVAVSGKRAERKDKTECLTWNYRAVGQPLSLFSGPA